METKRLEIWAVTDGNAGNESQALGLAEALARRRGVNISVKRMSPKGWAALLPAQLWHLLGARAGGWPFIGYAGKLSPPWPDLIIGAGRRIAPLVAALGKLHGVKAVQILNPQMPLAAFGLVVVPEHDRIAGPNVVATIGTVGRISPELVANEAALWRPRLAHVPERRVACLIGGSSKSAFWREADADRLVAQIAALSRSGVGLMITPSRRTDPVVVAGLKADCDPTTTFLWDGAGDNPYPGILGLANAVLVTEDSVNMVSEAAATGLPVHVFRVAGRAAQFAAFRDEMTRRGITRDFTGKIENWSYTPLAEADRVAAEIENRLL
jgi:mitochondrial fission protein ELM1